MLRFLNKQLENKFFPLTLRLITLLSFLVLVYIGFSGSSMSIRFLKELSLTNLTTSFVWRIWWPLIILSAIFFGRVWCMVCPVEMITTFFARIGIKSKRSSWLSSGWVITILYGVIVIAGITVVEVDRIPKYTALYLLTIICLSIVSGLIFEKNTFCRYICPVGYLLGIFSKMSLWGWRVRNRELCRVCPDKSCIKADHVYNLSSKSCGVGLFPANIRNNDHCLLCGGCIKTCKAYDPGNSSRPNPSLSKTGFGEGLINSGPLLFAEWIFLYLLSAHLIDEISEYRLISDLSSLVGHGSFMNYSGLNPGIHKNFIASIYLFLGLPVLLWFIPYLILTLNRVKMSLVYYMKNFSIVYIPVIAGLFTGLIIMEIATRFPYYKYILHDIRGIDTARKIITRQIIIQTTPDWIEWGLFLMMSAAALLGILLSFRVLRRMKSELNIQDTRYPILTAMPILFVLIFFAEVIMYRAF